MVPAASVWVTRSRTPQGAVKTLTPLLAAPIAREAGPAKMPNKLALLGDVVSYICQYHPLSKIHGSHTAIGRWVVGTAYARSTKASMGLRSCQARYCCPSASYPVALELA